MGRFSHAAGDGLFQENARGDGVGRQIGVVAERRALGEPVAPVEAECVGLLVAGFEAEGGQVGGAGFGFELGEDGTRDALAAGGRADVHALDLGEAIEEGDAAAASRGAVERGDEEAHVRLEDGFEWQPVALLGRVFGRQDVFQLRDQHADGVIRGSGEGHRKAGHVGLATRNGKDLFAQVSWPMTVLQR